MIKPTTPIVINTLNAQTPASHQEGDSAQSGVFHELLSTFLHHLGFLADPQEAELADLEQALDTYFDLAKENPELFDQIRKKAQAKLFPESSAATKDLSAHPPMKVDEGRSIPSLLGISPEDMAKYG